MEKYSRANTLNFVTLISPYTQKKKKKILLIYTHARNDSHSHAERTFPFTHATYAHKEYMCFYKGLKPL